MEKITKEVEETLLAVENTLSKFDATEINIMPFKASWTAGQLAGHVILANSGFLQVINGPVTETDKPADMMVAQMRNDLLNFSVKFNSPDEICPEIRLYSQHVLLARLEEIRNEISIATTSLDLTKTCSAFKWPVYGFLTRLEIVYFVIYHTRRYVHQLVNIYAGLNTN